MQHLLLLLDVISCCCGSYHCAGSTVHAAQPPTAAAAAADCRLAGDVLPTWRARSGVMGGTLSCSRHSFWQICSGTKSARAPINWPACNRTRTKHSTCSFGTPCSAAKCMPRMLEWECVQLLLTVAAAARALIGALLLLLSMCAMATRQAQTARPAPACYGVTLPAVLLPCGPSQHASVPHREPSPGSCAGWSHLEVEAAQADAQVIHLLTSPGVLGIPQLLQRRCMHAHIRAGQ